MRTIMYNSAGDRQINDINKTFRVHLRSRRCRNYYDTNRAAENGY